VNGAPTINVFCIRPRGFNIGNDVIYQGTLAFLQRAFGSAVNVISLPATSRYESHAQAGLTPRTVHEINRYGHGVIVGGGNLYENGELELHGGALDALEVPLLLFSLGWGRIYNRRHELVPRTDAMDPSRVRMLNDKAVCSLARDESTARYLRSLGCARVKVGGCPSLFLDQDLSRIPTFDEAPEVLLSVRTPELMNVPLADQGRVRSDVCEILEVLADRGYRDVKLLCHDHRDLAFAASFAGLGYLYTDDVFTYLGWLRSCRLNVGYRLHATLPCLALGTPTISISYDERATSLLESVGLGRWDINMMTCGDVAAAVADRLDRLDELSALRAQAQPRWQALRTTLTEAFEYFTREVVAQSRAPEPRASARADAAGVAADLRVGRDAEDALILPAGRPGRRPLRSPAPSVVPTGAMP